MTKFEVRTSGYHGVHCFVEGKLVCGWPEFHEDRMTLLLLPVREWTGVFPEYRLIRYRK